MNFDHIWDWFSRSKAVNKLITNLATGGYSNGARPIVIQEAQFVGEPLHDIRWQLDFIVHNDHVGWCHRTLTNTLRHQEEIVQMTTSHGMIQDDTWTGIVHTLLCTLKNKD